MLNNFIWYGVWAIAILAGIGLASSATQAAREAKCKRKGHLWSLQEHGWTCVRCRHYHRT